MSTLGAPGTASDLIFALRRLGMSGTVLHVGAHPDDEDVGTIAYLSRGLHVRTVYWSATRGEGGQNRHGPERAEALGIVRTWESLDARRVDGGEVLYGPFYDFGFSKSGEAALAAWGRDEMVKEVVRAIRLVQPQVVVSRWRGDPQDGHGHHQAVGLAVPEAFEAASDPRRFPELGLPAWRPLKLYASVAPDWQPGEDGAFRSTEASGDGVLVVSTGALEPVSGLTFQELGCLAFNRHRTQGMAFLPEPGDFFYSYRLIRSAADGPREEAGFFDGLDPTLSGMAAGAGPRSDVLRERLSEVQRHAERAVAGYRPGAPDEAGRHVLEGTTALRTLLEDLDGMGLDDHAVAALRANLSRKLAEFERTAARCLGLRLACEVAPGRVAPGGEFTVNVRMWNKGAFAIDPRATEVHVPDGWTITGRHGADSSGGAEVFEIAAPFDARLTSPYWLREPRTPYRYAWPENAPAGLPFDPPLITASRDVVIGNHRLTLLADGVHREVFVGGYRELPVAVLPSMALEPREASHLVPARSESQIIELQVEARSVHEGGAKGILELQIPPGWGSEPGHVDLVLPGPGETQSVRMKVTIPGTAPAGASELRYMVTSGERREGVVVRPVRRAAPGIAHPADESNYDAEAFLIAPAAVSVHLLDAMFVPALRHAYITGADEHILPSLSGFGLDVTVLDHQEVRYADLSRFDAIVVGPHAYLLREDVRTNAARLLRYVEDGGTLIVQFQGYGYQAPGLAPYPISYAEPHDRVTFADAPVQILRPDHPIFHLPNEINAADFGGWVLDRGLYFVHEWDPAYTSLLASNDPGEEPQGGGLFVAEYGRGTYVYAAYSFFRQIPAGVQGAVRLFANLLAIPEAKILQRVELARGLELFTVMADDQLHEVVRLMAERRFQAGSYLARQGEPGQELFLIAEGEIEILKETEGAARHYVARPGEAVGELAALADVPRSASLRARTDVRLLSMRGDHFRALLRQHPSIAEDVIKLLANRLATTEQVEPPSGSG